MTTTKNILKYGVLAGLFIIPFIPFIVPSAMFFPFITGKGFTFRIIVEIIFALFAVLALMEPSYRPKLSWITKSVLLFTFVILLADAFGVNPYKSIWSNYERMEGFVLIAHLFLYYIVTSSILNTRGIWNKYINTTIGASAIMSIYGVFQILGKATINQGGTRVDATFGNAAYLAIYLVFTIFLCIYMALDSLLPKWQRWAYGAVIFLELVVLYYTATRGAILGIIGGLALSAILILWKERENKTIKKSFTYLLGGLAVFVLCFFIFRNAEFVKNNQVLSRFSTLSFSEFKTQGRYFVWPMALKGVADRPILGWGQENFNFVFNKYYDPNMFGQEEWFDRTHNVVLDWLIAGGILGFASYALIYVALLYYIWRRNSNLKTSEKSILTGMIAAYVFHNMFVFDNLVSYIMFFTLLAFVHFLSEKNGEQNTVRSGSYYTKTFSADSLNYIALPLAVILMIGTIYYVNVPAVLANQTLIKAITPQQTGIADNLKLFNKVYSYHSFGDSEATEQLVTVSTQVSQAQSGVTDAQKQDFYNLAKAKVEEKIAKSPTDARYLVFAGSFFNRFGQYDEAIKYLERALAESPKKQSIFFELGSSYLGKKNYEKTMSLFKEAYTLKPSARESQILYALGAIYAGNSAVLKDLSSVIDQDTIISDNRFLSTYAAVGDYNSAINILNARLAKDPNNRDAKLSLASVYNTIGQKQKAIDIIRAIIASDPTFKEQGDFYIKQIQG